MNDFSRLRRAVSDPIPDFPGFVASLLARGCTRNPCRECCQDKGSEHVHLKHWDGHDGIVWADGRVSEFDLTQPARLIYPAAPRRFTLPFRDDGGTRRGGMPS